MKIRFDPSGQRDPNRDKGVRVPYGPTRRRSVRWRWYILLLLLCSPILYFIFNLGLSQVLVTARGAITLDPITVNCAGNGILQGISVAVGESVKSGDILAVLANPEVDEKEAILNSELAIFTGGDDSDVGTSTARLFKDRVGLARKQVDYRHTYLNKIRYLYQNGAATIAELNLAEAQHNQALFGLNEAQASFYTYLLRQSDAGNPANRSSLARTGRLKAELQAVGAKRERLTQKAPCAGRVLEIFASAGEALTHGAPLLSIGRLEQPTVIAYLDPKNANYATAGRKVKIRFPDGTSMDAQVRETPSLTKRLPPDTVSITGIRERMLFVELDLLGTPAPDKLVEGLPVEVRFNFLP